MFKHILSYIYAISFFTIILDYSQGLVYIEQKFGFELVIDRTRTCKIYLDKKKEKAKVERFLKYALCHIRVETEIKQGHDNNENNNHHHFIYSWIGCSLC